VRQAQIGEQLADPLIQRARLDFLRNAARSYWAWVAAGERYRIQQELLKLATARQQTLDDRLKKAQNIDELTVNENKRSISDRRELLLAAERSFQQESFLLSLFLRDAEGQPVVPSADRLPTDFLVNDPPPVDSNRVAEDVQTALGLRPELQRFRLLKERTTVDLRLAMNQFLPAANLGASVSQDLGTSKKTFTGEGPFASASSSVNILFNMDVPWQRREAQGRARIAQATLNQLQQQEKFAQDSIRAEVQDAISTLALTRQRLDQAREELKTAKIIVSQETTRVLVAGQSDLLLLNLREFNAAIAQTKIANLIAEYYRGYADYLVALGMAAGQPPKATLPPSQQPPSEVIPLPRGPQP
jgi:outer membrane protein TolC